MVEADPGHFAKPVPLMERNEERLEDRQDHIDDKEQQRRCDEKHRHQAQAVSVTGSHGCVPKISIDKNATGPACGPATQILLVDFLLHLIEALQNGVQTIRLDHEFLEAFHACLGHFGRGITVIELRQTRRC